MILFFELFIYPKLAIVYTDFTTKRTTHATAPTAATIGIIAVVETTTKATTPPTANPNLDLSLVEDGKFQFLNFNQKSASNCVYFTIISKWINRDSSKN